MEGNLVPFRSLLLRSALIPPALLSRVVELWVFSTFEERSLTGLSFSQLEDLLMGCPRPLYLTAVEVWAKINGLHLVPVDRERSENA